MQYEKYKDELIAYSSPELYSAYEVRVRRVRIIGASIFNWPLLGGAFLFHSEITNTAQIIAIIFFSILLSVLSIFVWKGLYRRAYKFRKNSIDVIRGESEKSLKKASTSKMKTS